MDPRLIERAANGDREAFGQLAQAAIDRLYRVAYRIARDPDVARDATQQALLEAWRDLPMLRDPKRWDAWTYRLIVRTCVREARRSRRAAGSVRLVALDEVTGPDTALWVADRDQLERGFKRLSAEQQAIVVLHHYVGLPLIAIASILGIPPGTARSRHHHALSRLRVAIEADSSLPSSTERRAL